jgi:hypothetical protein
MRGVTSIGDEPTSDFVGALEGTSIGNCRLFRLNWSHGILGVLQHHLPFPDLGGCVRDVGKYSHDYSDGPASYNRNRWHLQLCAP